MSEYKLSQMRKNNMKLYPIYQMIGFDFLFYYGIQVLFLSQVKHISDASIVLVSSLYACFSMILQVPISIFVDKVGKRKALIIGNTINTLCMFLILICPNIYFYIFEEFLNAIAFGIKNVTESSILNSSIPKSENKGNIFSKIDSKGYSKYCYISAISTLASGFLYDINPYIPVALCLLFCILTTIISYNFIELEEIKVNKKITEYTEDLRSGFKFIFKSSRLRSLLLMIGLIYGICGLFKTYRTTLLKELDVSATYIGIIFALYDIFQGVISKKANDFNEKYRNKTLTILAFGITFGFFVCGVVSLMEIPYQIKLTIVIFSYVLISGSKGIYQVMRNRYMSNFANSKILPKIY